MRRVLFAVRPIDGSSTAVGPRPSASSQMKAQVAPLSWDGSIPYVVRSRMKFGSDVEKANWFE